MGKPAPRVVSRRGLRGREPFGERRPPRRAARVPLAGYAVRRRPRQKGRQMADRGVPRQREERLRRTARQAPGSAERFRPGNTHPSVSWRAVRLRRRVFAQGNDARGRILYVFHFIRRSRTAGRTRRRERHGGKCPRQGGSREGSGHGGLSRRVHAAARRPRRARGESPGPAFRGDGLSRHAAFHPFPGAVRRVKRPCASRIASPAGSSGIWEPSASLAGLRRPV